MKRVGIISDTHSEIHHKFISFFNSCDLIIHAGDIGDYKIIEMLEKIAPVKAVYGNIDNQEIRQSFKKMNYFTIEGISIMLTHIGGYPKNYKPEIRNILAKGNIDLFICGHSHILKVIYDKQYKLLHINPGAAGTSGFHTVKTAIRLEISDEKMSNLEILEIPR